MAWDGGNARWALRGPTELHCALLARDGGVCMLSFLSVFPPRSGLLWAEVANLGTVTGLPSGLRLWLRIDIVGWSVAISQRSKPQTFFFVACGAAVPPPLRLLGRGGRPPRQQQGREGQARVSRTGALAKGPKLGPKLVY